MQWIQLLLAIIKLIDKAVPPPSNFGDHAEVVSWLRGLNDPTATMIVELYDLMDDKLRGAALPSEEFVAGIVKKEKPGIDPNLVPFIVQIILAILKWLQKRRA